MCMEDVRIGRDTYTYEGKEIIGTTATLLVPYDPDRICLILCAPQSGNTHFSTIPTMTTGDGIRFVTNTSPVVLNIKDHGDMVRRAWYAINSVGGTYSQYIASALTKR